MVDISQTRAIQKGTFLWTTVYITK